MIGTFYNRQFFIKGRSLSAQIRCLLCFFLFLSGTFRVQAQSLKVRLDSLLCDTLLYDSEVGLAVYDLTADTLLYGYQEEKLYRPASIEKVVTAVAALDVLGSQHPFETTLYYTGYIAEDSLLAGNLYVVGGFDPAFEQTDMTAMAAAVSELGIDSIAGRLIGNISLKDTLIWGSGWCWDDGMPPLSPLLYERSDSFLPVFQRTLHERGICVSDSLSIYVSSPPDSVITQVHQHVRVLEELLPRMMKKSDNLYAEAVFYHLAACNGHPYAGADEAIKVINDFIHRLGRNPDRYRIADGSGVSLYNYLSPVMLIDILKYAYIHPDIFRPLYKSLPIAGVDGTLRNRMKKRDGRAHGNVRAKTGTVTGVSSLAGYAYAGNGHLLAFVIINQNVLRARQVRSWQDRVCEELCR